MCNKNIIQMTDVDFSTSNDESNWLTNASTPMTTMVGKLVLKPDNDTSYFQRVLGTLDSGNNRIRLRINMDLFRPSDSVQDTIKAWFGIYSGSSLIGEFSVYKQGLSVGQKVKYNLDREFQYNGLSSSITLKVYFSEGTTNQLLFDDLKSENSNYCQDNIRTFFVLNEFLENSFLAISSGIQLLEWKVDGVETLTPFFFDEMISPGGAFSTRLFAKANIDGSNRVSNIIDPNTFNPFKADLGLTFDIVDSFYGGKPTGTISGNDYGAGIMSLGLEKPEVINGLLTPKKGAFFIDLDYTKSLKIVFNVLINNQSENIFENPTIFRKYFILWDAETCTKSFYYQDVLSGTSTNHPINEDGFLSGLTGENSVQKTISCGESLTFNGGVGVYEFQMDFGNNIGIAGINFDSLRVPDKFEIEWNGQIVSTGYVGENTYDQDLLNNGISPAEINTGEPTTGFGNLTFFKNQAIPNLATIRVYSPLIGGTWKVVGICPYSSNATTPVINSITFPLIDSINNIVNVATNVVSDGGMSLIEVGVCYNQTGSPTVSDTKIVLDQIVGPQNGIINLPSNGSWYFCAYAINDIGITYFCYGSTINI